MRQLVPLTGTTDEVVFRTASFELSIHLVDLAYVSEFRAMDNRINLRVNSRMPLSGKLCNCG